MCCISLHTMHQQHSLNHVWRCTAESRDRANINHSQEASISHSQPGAKKRCTAEPDVVTQVSLQRDLVFLFLPPVFMSLDYCQCAFTGWGPAVESMNIFCHTFMLQPHTKLSWESPLVEKCWFLLLNAQMLKWIHLEFHTTKENGKSLDPKLSCNCKGQQTARLFLHFSKLLV